MFVMGRFRVEEAAFLMHGVTGYTLIAPALSLPKRFKKDPIPAQIHHTINSLETEDPDGKKQRN
ncbi:MAG: hypothetical protein DRG82_02710 [Deltaproteobacteria bacterium]|nr:MAG: hypothetical protein DRG82_02710 [Deltaproteobacteria bacterium]